MYQGSGETLHIAGREKRKGEYETQCKGKEQRRRETTGTAHVEVGEAERFCAGDFRSDQLRNKKAADHKKDINPYKSPAKIGESNMEKQDTQYGQGAQSVDIGSVLHSLLESHSKAVVGAMPYAMILPCGFLLIEQASVVEPLVVIPVDTGRGIFRVAVGLRYS